MAERSPRVLDRTRVLLIELHLAKGYKMESAQDLSRFARFFDFVFVQHQFRLWWLRPAPCARTTRQHLQPRLLKLGVDPRFLCYETGLLRARQMGTG